MRITNSMLAENTLKNINKAANRMADAGERESSQQKIQSASDDPVTATRAVAYRSYVSQIKQYQDNADAASGWQKATDTALSDLTDVLQSMRELTNQAATDTVNEDDRLDIKADVETLQEQAISIMNRTYAGRYIFGGYSTQEAPYELKETDIGDTVTFKGNYLSLCGVVSADIDDADIISFYNSNKTSVSGSLAVAASAAVTQATTAAAAAAADPTDAVLAAKSVAAQATSTTLAAAVTTYGSATTVADAAAVAQTDYETAKSAAAADPSDTALAAAASAAKNLYDVLTDTITGSEQNIEYHIGFSEVTTVNAEGQDVSGEGTGNNMFDTFAKLLLALNGGHQLQNGELRRSGKCNGYDQRVGYQQFVE